MQRRKALPRNQQILAAAAELFAVRGFDSTGVGAIAERIGISGPAIYSHFRSKDEILVTLLLGTLERLTSQIGPSTTDSRADLQRLIEVHSRTLLENRQLANVYVREGRSLGKDSHEVVDRRLDEYIDCWVEALDRCYPGRERTRLVSAANAAMGIANSIVLWPDEALTAPGLQTILVDMTLRALSVLES
jgi:AcrR family transcriptional regulator